jgi:hypothetical protein
MGTTTDLEAVGILVGSVVAMMREAEQEENDDNQANGQGDAKEEQARIDKHSSMKIIITAV